MKIVVGVLAFILGFITALVIANLCKKPVGILRVDQSDPDDVPYLFLEMTEDPRVLTQGKYITLKVNMQNYISHN